MFSTATAPTVASQEVAQTAGQQRHDKGEDKRAGDRCSSSQLGVVGGVETYQRGHPTDRDRGQHHRPDPPGQQPSAGCRADQHCDDEKIAERLYGDQCRAGKQKSQNQIKWRGRAAERLRVQTIEAGRKQPFMEHEQDREDNCCVAPQPRRCHQSQRRAGRRRESRPGLPG